MTGPRSHTIDVHAHLLPPDLISEVPENGSGASHGATSQVVQIGSFGSRPVPRMLTDLDVRVSNMDRQGVDVQVLSGWTELLAYDLSPGIATDFARRHNAAMAASVGRNPERLLALATAPLQDPAAAGEVLDEAMRDLGLVGVQIGTNVAGANLDDPRLEPFWAAAERLQAFVLIHPAQARVAGKERMGSYYFENLIGNPFETALAGASLIFGGVLERHPYLTVCLAHGGGFLPYQIGRLMHGYGARAECRERLLEGVDASFQRLYFDTILHSRSNLRHLVSLVGADHVLLGSDYPFDMAEDQPLRLAHSLGLGPGQTVLIAGGNARRLLGL